MSDAFIAGLALAAALAGDRELGSVQRALPADWIAAARGELQRRRGTGPSARAGQLRALMARVHGPIVEPVALPPRGRTLLASEVSRALGRAWLSQTGAPRAGFRADALLTRALRRVARRPHDAGDP